MEEEKTKRNGFWTNPFLNPRFKRSDGAGRDDRIKLVLVTRTFHYAVKVHEQFCDNICFRLHVPATNTLACNANIFRDIGN